MDGSIYLASGEATAAHGYLVPVEDAADRTSLDTELCSQFVHGCSVLVAGDQFRDPVGAELPRPPWFGPFDGRQGRCYGVG